MKLKQNLLDTGEALGTHAGIRAMLLGATCMLPPTGLTPLAVYCAYRIYQKDRVITEREKAHKTYDQFRDNIATGVAGIGFGMQAYGYIAGDPLFQTLGSSLNVGIAIKTFVMSL